MQYDNFGKLTSAVQAGNALAYTSDDAFGRNLSQTGPLGTLSSQWDLANRRTRVTHPGAGLYVDYEYLVTGEMAVVRENGAASGVGVLATIAYDNLGLRTSMTRGNGTVTGYTFDAVSRLATLTENLASTLYDQSAAFSYSPANQIDTVTRGNDAYAWTGHGSGSTVSLANGLNQQAWIGGATTTHDARGNLIADPTTGKAYGYNSENLLTSTAGGTSALLSYDPSMRIYEIAAATTTRFAYDGLNSDRRI